MRPKKGALIVCANHKHVMDQCPILISPKRMVHYMAKKEYFDGKFAWFFKASGCIPVNRSIKDTDAKNRALNLLKAGYAVGLFPEGTRNKTKDFLLPFTQSSTFLYPVLDKLCFNILPFKT